MKVHYLNATESDFDELAELRLEAMRKSLENIGRFDRARSIERFRSSFVPSDTKQIICDDVLVGFYSLTSEADHLHLTHFYVKPEHQGLGIGSFVMARLIAISDDGDLPIRLGALKESRSNDFYQKHGFIQTSEDEWDIYYERSPTKKLGPMIRKYQPGDVIAIGQIYYNAVHQLTCDDYNEEQRQAWATPFSVDDPEWAEKWRKRCELKQPWVAAVDDEIAGFIEFEADGHIDCTYASPAHAGQGHMSAIMERIFDEARCSSILRLYAEVSITARPFFERHGFCVVRENHHEVRGVPIMNYIMERWL